ncbi:MAG: hypothetical protein ACRDHE_00750, partial [Ktedonobacterales bacterium]
MSESTQPAETTEQTEPTPHIPHAPHPPELRERAFTLHCQFQSNAVIAATLRVPERTVRSWVSELLDETTKDLKEHRYDALREAVASQRAIAAAAWQAFTLSFDHGRSRLAEGRSSSPSPRKGKGLGDEDTQPSGNEPTTIYRSARLLTVAFAAQREIAKLLRLYEDDVVPHVPIEILITRNPPWPEPDPSDWDADDPDAPDPDDPNGGGGRSSYRPSRTPEHT